MQLWYFRVLKCFLIECKCISLEINFLNMQVPLLSLKVFPPPHINFNSFHKSTKISFFKQQHCSNDFQKSRCICQSCCNSFCMNFIFRQTIRTFDNIEEKWFEQLFTDMLGKVTCGIEEATSLEVSPACSKWIGCKPDGTCGDLFVC